MKVEFAIKKLRQRLENYVSRHGVDAYARETGDLLNAVIDYYNRTMKLENRLDSILFLAEVPDVVSRIPTDILEYMAENKLDFYNPCREDIALRYAKELYSTTEYFVYLYYLLQVETDEHVFRQQAKELYSRYDSFRPKKGSDLDFYINRTGLIDYITWRE